MSTAPQAGPAAAPPAAASSTPGSTAIDEFLHTPARLNICALLAPAQWVTFSFLRDAVATSDSALSKQITALEQIGYLEVRKERAVRRQTSVRLTQAGRDAFDAYLATLELLVARARGGL